MQHEKRPENGAGVRTMTTTDTVRPGTVAPLKNVAACLALVETLKRRPAHLDGVGVFSGFSGYGKSVAGQYAWNKTGAVFLEVFDYWRGKKFCQALLMELGLQKPRGTIGDMMDEIIARMGDDPDRPLIIDEADKLVDKGLIELVRDIHKATRCPVLLIGEERLPAMLEQVERMHNRVLDWVLAEPCDLADTRALARCLYPQLAIADALLDRIRAETRGTARRIATTLHEVAAFARNAGQQSLDDATYGGRIFTGVAPKRRAA
jgi:DNA transposition AAA+ family ATPase